MQETYISVQNINYGESKPSTDEKSQKRMAFCNKDMIMAAILIFLRQLEKISRQARFFFMLVCFFFQDWYSVFSSAC